MQQKKFIPVKFLLLAFVTANTYFIGGCFSDYTLQIDYTTNKMLLRLDQNYPSYRCLKYKAEE